MCLLCSAVCPTGALSCDSVSSLKLLRKLEKIEAPVLACSGQTNTQGHARVPCLGVFADHDLLLALALMLDRPLTLNMTGCKQCRNSAVIRLLEETIVNLPAEVQINLIVDQKKLNFEEQRCDRREFFNLVRPAAMQVKNGITDPIELNRVPTDYKAKRLPASRELLVQTIRFMKENNKQCIEPTWPLLHFDNNCKGCGMCIALCPTGALSAPKGKQLYPAVCAERCVACALCEEACPEAAIKLPSKGEQR